jgi:sulfate/thiosulfate transport system ATP-binding protein
VSIEVQHVSKRFGSFQALDDVSLDIAGGSLTAVLGPSGSGKSTLLRIVAGLEPQDSGAIRLAGADATPLAPQKRGVGFVFQHYAAFKHMTVRDNVAFGLKIRKRPGAEIRTRVDELLELVQLQGFGHRYPAQLSGGQRQRMALARALAPEPKVLLLDEPFGALDARVRAELRGWLRRLHAERHTTTVFVTHDQEEAMAISDRIVVMNQGTVEQVGTARDIYERPTTRFVADFIGTANLLHARVIEGSVSGLRIEAEGQLELLVDAPSDLSAGSRVAAVIRPEELRVRPAKEGRDVLPPNSAAGRVDVASYLGPLAELNVRLDAGPTMLVRGDNQLATRYTSGARVVLTWDAVAVYLFPE